MLQARSGLKRAVIFRADNVVRDAWVAGVRITVNLTWVAAQHLCRGELVDILRDYPLVSDLVIWAVYPQLQVTGAQGSRMHIPPDQALRGHAPLGKCLGRS